MNEYASLKNVLILCTVLHCFLCYVIEDENVAILLPLAREYQISGLTKRCEDYLLSREPSVHSLVLAEEFLLPALEKKCLYYVTRL